MRIIEQPQIFRTNLRKQLVSRVPGFEGDVNNFVENLERGIFNFAIKEATNQKVVKKWENPFFVQIYLDRFKTIYNNVNNPYLSKLIKEKSIKPHVIALMTHQEMEPDKWSALFDAKMKRDKHKYETRMEAATDTFKCHKCKSKECTYYQMQTRSADEPMTTFVTCIKCGNRWKC